MEELVRPGNLIKINVNTSYCNVDVSFTIVKCMSHADNIYLAFAQERLALIQYKADCKWYLLRSLDISAFLYK
jgi:hypothetical protein